MRKYTLKEIKNLWQAYKMPVLLVKDIDIDRFISSQRVEPGQIIAVDDLEKTKLGDISERMSFPDFIVEYEKDFLKKKKNGQRTNNRKTNKVS